MDESDLKGYGRGGERVRIAVGMAGLLLVVGLQIFCSLRYWGGPVEYDSGCRLIMGTVARVICVAEDANSGEDCVNSAFEQLDRVNRLMSNYDSDSEISRINRSAYGGAVTVDEMTFEVLERAVEFSKITGGAFDVTVGPLVELWRLAGSAGHVPSKEMLEKDKSKAGYENLILDRGDRSVRFAVKGMSIDLGGIAKGYAIDMAVEAMKCKGAIAGMVDIGGDIRCFDKRQSAKHWFIGVQDPTKVSEGLDVTEPLLVLKIRQGAVATSGNYRRFVAIEDKKYSHIINRKTGRSAEGLSSVTVIAETAIEADGLATAVSVMGAEAGLCLVESLDNVEAILVGEDTNWTIAESEGASEFIGVRARSKKILADSTKIEKNGYDKAEMGTEVMEYKVLRTEGRPQLNGDWWGDVWGSVEAIELGNYMGDEPQHRPRTQAKLMYDDEYIYVLFRVEDEYVRAVAEGRNGNVWQDSCAEFFFTPADDVSAGYFNVEVNCGGTMLFHYQRAKSTDVTAVSDVDCDRIEVYHSQPKIVEPETEEPTTWLIEYRIPVDILEKYKDDASRPAGGVSWRANFYKCGDNTSHPHWLTWSKVELPEPDFHQPRFFGILSF